MEQNPYAFYSIEVTVLDILLFPPLNSIACGEISRLGVVRGVRYIFAEQINDSIHPPNRCSKNPISEGPSYHTQNRHSPEIWQRRRCRRTLIYVKHRYLLGVE